LFNILSIFQEAVGMIKPIEDAEEAAKRLMQEAYQRGSADNITCVVVRFLMNQGTSSHSSSNQFAGHS
jgi:protein phosphatase 1L